MFAWGAGAPDAEERFAQFCATLKNHADPELASLGRRVGLATLVQALGSGESTDPQAVVAEFQELVVAEEKTEELLILGSQVAAVLAQLQFTGESEQILSHLTEAYADVDDPALAAQVASLTEERRLLQLGLQEKFAAVIEGQPGANEAFLEALGELFAGGPTGRTTVRFALHQAAGALETLAPEVAAEVFAMVGAAYDGHPGH